MGFKIEGLSGNVVEATGNQLHVKLPATASTAGFATVQYEQDSGSVTSVPLRRAPNVSMDARLSTGLDTLLFSDSFNGIIQNTGNWRHIFAVMTTTMGSGSMLMNANSNTASLSGINVTTWRMFPLTGAGGLRYEIILSFTEAPLANQVFECGFFPYGTGAAAPTEGVFLRYTNAGLVGVASHNGVEGTPVTLPATFTTDQTYTLGIRLNQRRIEFTRDDIILGVLNIPSGQGFPTMAQAYPISHQFRNGGLVSGSSVMQCKINGVTVIQKDCNTVKPWAHQQCMQGLSGYQVQNGTAPLSTSNASTALYTNNLVPGVGAAMANATAGLGVGLGGQFSCQPTLASGTDGILCSYLNPAPSINITGRTLVVMGVRIQGIITTALTGGPLLYFYSLCFGHNALTLLQLETGSFVTAGTKTPRRIALGMETYAATAAVGTLGQGVYVTFQAPIVVNPGEYVAVAAKNVGTVTTAGVITWLVTYDAYVE